MAPRHYLRPVPYALSLRPGAVISGAVPLAQPALKVVSTGGGNAVRGANDSTTAGAVAGVNAGAGPGGYFSSNGSEALLVDGGAYVGGDLTVGGSVWASSYENVVVVAKGGGGDFSTIQAALDSIGDATEDNPRLVRVMPGVYNEQVTLKPFVTVLGSGRNLTVISYTVESSGLPTSGTVVGADDATLADLTVVNHHDNNRGAAIYNSYVDGLTIDGVAALAGGGDYSYGIYNDYSSPEIRNSIATASGSESNHGIYSRHSSPQILRSVAVGTKGTQENATHCYAIFNYSSEAVVEDSTALVSGCSFINYAIYNTQNTDATIRDCTIEGREGSGVVGIHNSTWVSATIEDSTISVSGIRPRAVLVDWNSSATLMRTTASATTTDTLESCRGLLVEDDSSATANFSTISARGGSEAYGVMNERDSTATLFYSTISATLGTMSYGIYNTSATTPTEVLVQEGRVAGSDYAIYNDDADFTVRVLGTWLEGGTNVTGTYQCLLAHDGTALLGGDCQ